MPFKGIIDIAHERVWNDLIRIGTFYQKKTCAFKGKKIMSPGANEPLRAPFGKLDQIRRTHLETLAMLDIRWESSAVVSVG